MKFLVDECCAIAIARYLKEKGHNVLHISNEKPGASDDEVFAFAKKKKRILITNNVKHFRGSKCGLSKTPGRILIDSSNALTQEIILEKLLTIHKQSGDFAEKIFILNDKKYRIINKNFKTQPEKDYKIPKRKK